MKVREFQAYIVDNEYIFNKLNQKNAISEEWATIKSKLPQVLVVANIDDDGVNYPTPKAKVAIGAANAEKAIPASGVVLLDLSAAKDTYLTTDTVIKVYNDTQEDAAQTMTIRGVSEDVAMRIIDTRLRMAGQTDLAHLLHAIFLKPSGVGPQGPQGETGPQGEPGKDAVLKAATKEAIGGVKAVGNIVDLDGGAELAVVVEKVNALLAGLRTCGILI